MKKIATCYLLLIISLAAFTPPKEPSATPRIIFAVFDDGNSIEPIAIVEDGKMEQPVNGSDDGEGLRTFSDTYYQPKASYDLIYGAKVAGKVMVIKSNLDSDCGATTAQVRTSSQKIKLKGFEMALATTIKPAKIGSGVRRAASTAEKIAIEKLVVKEFQKNKVSVKGMKLVKLTCIDVDDNKVNEFVGTYTVSPSTKERALLFFIATKLKTGTYAIKYSELERIKQDEVMSGDIRDVDNGIYQEMLLDFLDTDDDGIAELFTVKDSFEGVGYNSYKLKGGKWERVLEGAIYHCGY
jgi:hypothetical protein